MKIIVLKKGVKIGKYKPTANTCIESEGGFCLCDAGACLCKGGVNK